MLLLKVYLLFGVYTFVTSAKYDGYKVYEVNLQNQPQADFLYQLSHQNGIDGLHIPRTINNSAHIMVSPRRQCEFEKTLARYSLNYDVIISDIEKFWGEQGRTVVGPRKSNENGIRFTRYYRHSEINEYLELLARKYPNTVSVYTVGKSYEGRAIKVIRINNGQHLPNKKVIFIDAGIHAREWIAPATALYIIYQLVENMEANRQLLDKYDWIILPLVNPDGYEYSHTNDRMWRKTRSKNFICYGTDANRNFGYHWGEVGASYNPCSDIYRGSKAFSEPETKTVRDILLSLKGTGVFYLSLHSYGNYILYPWGWTRKLPENHEILHEIAAAGADAIRSATGSHYTCGSSTRVLYSAAGGSDDYAYGTAGFPVTFTMELPPGGSGFDPPPSKIQSFTQEAWIGIKAMAEKVAEKY